MEKLKSLKAIIAFVMLSLLPMTVSAGPSISYPLNSSPEVTDNLIGIDDPSGAWAIQRYSLSSILDLWLSLDNTFTGAIIPKIITNPGAACTANEVGIYPSGETSSRWYACESGSWVPQSGNVWDGTRSVPLRAPVSSGSINANIILSDELAMGHIYKVRGAYFVQLPDPSEYLYPVNGDVTICNVSNGSNVDVETTASFDILLNGAAIPKGNKARSNGGGECLWCQIYDFDTWECIGTPFVDGGP